MRGCQIPPPGTPAMAPILSATALGRSPFPAFPYHGMPQRGVGAAARQTPCRGNGGFGASWAPQRDLAAMVSLSSPGLWWWWVLTPLCAGTARGVSCPESLLWEKSSGEVITRSILLQSQLSPNEETNCFYESHKSICPSCLISSRLLPHSGGHWQHRGAKGLLREMPAVFLSRSRANAGCGLAPSSPSQGQSVVWDRRQPQPVLLPQTAWVRGKHRPLLWTGFSLSSARRLSSPNHQGRWVMRGHPSPARRTCIQHREPTAPRERFGEGQKMGGLTKLMPSPEIPICLEIVQFSREYPNENISQENTNTFPVLGQIHPCREVGFFFLQKIEIFH